jgi:hypothetical protein
VSGRVARRLFTSAVSRLPVSVRLAGDDRPLGRGGPEMTVHDPDEFFARIGSAGLIGFGEAYLTQAWEADDLGAVLTVLAAELPQLVPASLQRLRAAYVARPPRHQRSSVRNAQANIGHHYDLSNDLFETFLDETMTYSSALFNDSHPGLGAGLDREVLREAQVRKIERLLDATGVGRGTRLLEIGTGWGELAIRAARRGAVVDSVTLSVEQQSLARQRIAAAAADGSFDAGQVSVELGLLGLAQRRVGGLEVRAGVGHRLVEERLEHVVAEVVVRGDVASRPLARVARDARGRGPDRRDQAAEAIEAGQLARPDPHQRDQVVGVPAAVRIGVGQREAPARQRIEELGVVHLDGRLERRVLRAELARPAVADQPHVALTDPAEHQARKVASELHEGSEIVRTSAPR